MESTFAHVNDVANKSYDYIIIGGGVAGSVIASRLTENSERNVLLIEAGKGRITDHAIDKPQVHPMWFNEQLGKPDYDWFFQTTLQEDIKGRSLLMPRGKGLGGTSNINFQAWTRPGREDIDAWEKLGNPGWGFEDFLPYLRKPEKFHAPSSENMKAKALTEDQYWFGKDGPIPISFSEAFTGLDGIIRSSSINRGIPFNPNPALGDFMGYWSNVSSMDPATLQRFTAFKGYIVPNLGRKNLTVITEAYATKLLINARNSPNNTNSDEHVTAEGVQFVVNGGTYVAYATKEVLLCAGSVKTPQLLELSGIGNPDILKPLGIPVFVDLPGVGENLQDHYLALNLAFEIRPDFECSTIDMLKDPAEYKKQQKLYDEKKNGLLSFTHSEIIFTSLQVISPSAADELIARCEKQLADRLSSLSAGSARYRWLKEQSDIQLALLKDPKVPDVEMIFCPYISGSPDEGEPGKKYFSVGCGGAIAFSRGKIHISSADPLLPPRIDLNSFDYPIELDVLVETFKWARKYIEYEPFKSVVVKEANPGSAVVTDEQIRDYFKDTIFPEGHTASTASMLPSRENLGVVDPKLKVYGTTNIRVCDCSIAPIGVSIHPQSTVYAIAEKAADIIISGV